jgi:hypothetical protein
MPTSSQLRRERDDVEDTECRIASSRWAEKLKIHRLSTVSAKYIGEGTVHCALA